MLQLQPSLLSQMQDDHFLAALNTEPCFLRTSVELELMHRLDVLAANELPENVESRLEKEYEVQLEESEFRVNLIREIQLLCEQPGSKKDLVDSMNSAILNSLVEL